MEILLKRYKGSNYVWKQATYSDRNYNVEGTIVSPVSVLSVRGFENGKYVACQNCGAKIENNPESIERHFAESEVNANCLTCQHAKSYYQNNTKETFTPNGDGTYSVSATYNARVRCGKSWQDISTPEAKTYCHYRRCRMAGVKAAEDILMQHPDLFETQITIDVLLKKNYNYEATKWNYFVYDMQCRGTLHALVNDSGIVDHFIGSYRNRSYELYYSAKYDKVFFNDYGQYTEGKPGYMSDTKFNTLVKKIKALYKEVKTNE